MSKQAVKTAVDALCAADLDAQERAVILQTLFERILERGQPMPAFGALQDEARWWARGVSSIEAEAYLAAICDSFAMDKGMAEAQRKRLIVRLWEGMTNESRKAFIDRVTDAR